jgi:C-terminal processing protease CtpA/Prc
LKSCLNGYGAHVDSFYSASSGAPMTTTDQKCLSITEKKGMLLGDVILAIENVSVEMMELDQIKELLLQLRSHPITLVIQRYISTETNPNEVIISDVRNRLWLKKYLRDEKKLPVYEKQYDLYLKINEYLAFVKSDTFVHTGNKEAADCQQFMNWKEIIENDPQLKPLLLSSSQNVNYHQLLIAYKEKLLSELIELPFSIERN